MVQQAAEVPGLAEDGQLFHRPHLELAARMPPGTQGRAKRLVQEKSFASKTPLFCQSNIAPVEPLALIRTTKIASQRTRSYLAAQTFLIKYLILLDFTSKPIKPRRTLGSGRPSLALRSH